MEINLSTLPINHHLVNQSLKSINAEYQMKTSEKSHWVPVGSWKIGSSTFLEVAAGGWLRHGEFRIKI